MSDTRIEALEKQVKRLEIELKAECARREVYEDAYNKVRAISKDLCGD